MAMMRGGRQERFFTKRQPAAAPQVLDRQAAQIEEGIQGNGPLVPVREVTQLDSVGMPRPLSPLMPLEDGIERTVEPTNSARSGDEPRSQPGRDLRVTPTPTTSRSTRRMMAQAPAPRGAKRRMASRSGGNSHPALFSSAPASTSMRRMMTPATGSRGTTSRVAQSYIESANRQMDKGNYMAAIANYKRAGQADGNSSAAKTRMERARRAMQAENKIIANRR